MEEKSERIISEEENKDKSKISKIIRSELHKIRDYKTLFEVPANESSQILLDYKLHYGLSDTQWNEWISELGDS